jgi:hypothetical protein
MTHQYSYIDLLLYRHWTGYYDTRYLEECGQPTQDPAFTWAQGKLINMLNSWPNFPSEG